MFPTPVFSEKLQKWKAAAEQVNESLEGSVIADLNGQPFQVAATGAKGGFRYRLTGDNALILIGSPKREWTISVRYLSGPLWTKGARDMRDETLDALRFHCVTKKGDKNISRISRMDYAMDIHSPEFTREFRDSISRNVVAHSSVKKHDILKLDTWTHGLQGETLTIGKPPGAVVQLYNKSQEITDISGKTYMWDIWTAGNEGEWPWSGDPVDVWRIEPRMNKKFFRDRNILTLDQAMDQADDLIGEILANRRLCCPSDDPNRNRWQTHPMWSIALDQVASSHLVPVGRQVLGRRDALSHRAQRQLAGALRSATVLQFGHYSDLRRDEVTSTALKMLDDDPQHGKKIEAARARYLKVDEPE